MFQTVYLSIFTFKMHTKFVHPYRLCCVLIIAALVSTFRSYIMKQARSYSFGKHSKPLMANTHGVCMHFLNGFSCLDAQRKIAHWPDLPLQRCVRTMEKSETCDNIPGVKKYWGHTQIVGSMFHKPFPSHPSIRKKPRVISFCRANKMLLMWQGLGDVLRTNLRKCSRSEENHLQM